VVDVGVADVNAVDVVVGFVGGVVVIVVGVAIDGATIRCVASIDVVTVAVVVRVCVDAVVLVLLLLWVLLLLLLVFDVVGFGSACVVGGVAVIIVGCVVDGVVVGVVSVGVVVVVVVVVVSNIYIVDIVGVVVGMCV